MPNRREFLQLGVAASALPALAAPTHENESENESPIDVGPAMPVQVGMVIVEAASPFALAFRDEAASLGLQIRLIHDDITDLWYQDLSRLWDQGPAVLAGVTLSTSLFCLETLARDHRLRVRFRAIHTSLPNGHMEHAISGPAPMVEVVAAGPDWAGGFARLISAPFVPEPAGPPQKFVTPSTPQGREPGPMVSWVIAPRSNNRSGLVS